MKLKLLVEVFLEVSKKIQKGSYTSIHWHKKKIEKYKIQLNLMKTIFLSLKMNWSKRSHKIMMNIQSM